MRVQYHVDLVDNSFHLSERKSFTQKILTEFWDDQSVLILAPFQIKDEHPLVQI